MLKKIVAMIGAFALMAGTVVSAIAEGISEPAFPSVTTEDGYTVEISKAYYNDNSVFVWYKLSGDITYTELHEGAPDENIQWKHVFEDTIAAEKWSNDSPLLQQALEWLDGQGQRWTFCQIARFLDGLELEDGSYADMIAGEEEYLEDGSISGWRECKIPEGKNSDSIAEAEIYEKFNDIVGDKTAIYISHRLSSCKFCDEIMVFDHGKVVQQGTHAALVAEKGCKYSQLWNAQAQYYT